MNAFIQHLGEDYQGLKDVVKDAHIGDIKLHGHVAVSRGNVIANVLCNILGMPKTSDHVELTVYGSHSEQYMKWRRLFGATEMTSTFVRDGEYFVESMGPIKLWMKLANDNGQLVYRLVKSRFLFMPLPASLSPTLSAYETEKDGQYAFSVNVGLPFIGKLIEYSGLLDLEKGNI